MVNKINSFLLELETQANNLLRNNLMIGTTKTRPIQNYTYICPDKNKYPHQWLWDSCFHIIVNCHLNIDLAKKEFETLLSKQKSDGFISHMIYWKNKLSFIDKIILKYYNTKLTSSITQTPLIPKALRAIFIQTNDIAYISKFLPKVKKFYDYLYQTRIFPNDPIPLLNIIHTWESGIDNSPIYDKALNLSGEGKLLTVKWMKSLIKQLKVLKECNWDINIIREKDFFLYKDLLFNCVYIQGCRDLAFLFRKINNVKESQLYENRAIRLEEILIKNCWDKKEEFFFGLYSKNNIKDSVKSAISFIPLILDNLPYGKAISIVEEHLLNEKEFWLEYPVPSVALNEPTFTEKSKLLWRGPTWISLNWFIINGLKKHGFTDLALKLSNITLKLIREHGFREFYSPKTGKGMGAKNFSWSTLVIDIEKSKLNSDLSYLFWNRDWRHIKKGGFG
ncbi:MAG: MGH1-like glycoside hydrolase domain-containing protein [Promethearchaeota archaeon]